MKNIPFITKKNKIIISEDQFFEFFESKKLKLIIAILAGIIGVISNYYAIQSLILHLRIDMIGENMVGIYAIGLTGFLDLAIILFTLMNVAPLSWFSTIIAFIISLYANTTMMLQSAGGSSFSSLIFMLKDPNTLLQFSVGICMAILPLVILKYLVNEAVKQRKREKNA
jgi:hypothetical protein